MIPRRFRIKHLHVVCETICMIRVIELRESPPSPQLSRGTRNAKNRSPFGVVCISSFELRSLKRHNISTPLQSWLAPEARSILQIPVTSFHQTDRFRAVFMFLRLRPSVLTTFETAPLKFEPRSVVTTTGNQIYSINLPWRNLLPHFT